MSGPTSKRPAPSRRRGQARGGKGGAEPRARIRERAARVLALDEQGYTQTEIAQAVRVSQAAVSKILQREDARAVAALESQAVARAMRSLRRLDYVAREGRRAWESSKQGRVRKRQRKTEAGAGTPAVTHELTVDEGPDPRLLEQARKAEEAIATICGVTGGGRRDRDHRARDADEGTPFVFTLDLTTPHGDDV